MALAFVLGGAYFLTARFSEVDDPYKGPSSITREYIWDLFWPILTAAVVAAIGAGMLATVLSSRLRVAIIARDKEGKPSELMSSRVLAYLTELAGSPPHGMQLPNASDATALSSSVLVELSANKTLATLQKLFQAVFAIVPWTVSIDGSNDGSLYVVMKRNGWTIDAVTADTAAIPCRSGRRRTPPRKPEAQRANPIC
ncbi:hypothetical protein NHF46_04195 [Arthrobacter alpinus]|nr:hypothetical protein [Arthrobacter alpinus]